MTYIAHMKRARDADAAATRCAPKMMKHHVSDFSQLKSVIDDMVAAVQRLEARLSADVTTPQGALATPATASNAAEAVSQRYARVVRAFRKLPSAKYFRDPVDWQKLKLWDYRDIVKTPMDLNTVVRKLASRKYETAADLRADVDLIWENAIAYNGSESWIVKYVDVMRRVANRELDQASTRDLHSKKKKRS